MKRAVFLDRDGVINAMVYNTEFGLVDSPANPEEFRLLPDVSEAIRLINQLGFLAIVISNQPGIAKGKFSPALLDAMTEKMLVELRQQQARIDAIYYCPHHPEGIVGEYRKVCECRKPKPGMLLKAAQEWDISLQESYFIGDGITDIQAGSAAGVSTILIYPSSRCYLCDELNRQKVQPDHLAKNLLDGVHFIRQLEQQKQGQAV